MDTLQLEEYLKTAKNRIEIATVLIQVKRPDLLPTILEDLQYTVQLIIDDFCVAQ